jgi:hypothetical protein
MKRLATVVAAGALILGLAWPAAAQQNFTVTFGGQFRVFGLVWDNMTDFTDTDKPSSLFPTQIGRAKDSEAYYFQRWRLFTTVESQDKQAKIVWAVEVGDITWGLGGGASGDEFGSNPGTRVGPSQGGGLGADGVNVETKLLYLQFNIPWIKDANILLGAHNITFLGTPAGNFMDDDGWGIQLNFKFDPVDLQLYTVKVDENTRAGADDNDMYAARIGVNLTKDTRVTLEGLIVNRQCFARRGDPTVAGAPNPTGNTFFPPAAPTPADPTRGNCVSEDFGDTFWVGATAGTKIAGITLHGAFVYGQRRLWSIPIQTQIEESGYGFQFVAQAPLGPVSTWWHAWYISGDETRITGGCVECVTAHPAGRQPLPNLTPGLDFSTNANGNNLIVDSDKLPLPITGASWANVPFVAEFVRGITTVGAPGFGSTHYSDATGTWGIGGSATYALTPAFSVGGGVAYIEAVESATTCAITIGGVTTITRCGGGVYGDHLIELDAGAIWRYNPNLTISGLFGYVIPDVGDDAYGLVFRTQFSF